MIYRKISLKQFTICREVMSLHNSYTNLSSSYKIRKAFVREKEFIDCLDRSNGYGNCQRLTQTEQSNQVTLLLII